MNRRQRRAAKRAGLRVIPLDARIPVFGPHQRAVALIGRDELRWYERAENAVLVRESGRVVEIRLQHSADDSHLVVHRGNPRRYSHDRETEQNPPRVWTMRRLGSDDRKAEQYVREIYRASVIDNLVAFPDAGKKAA
jgi:hypothetical protein